MTRRLAHPDARSKDPEVLRLAGDAPTVACRALGEHIRAAREAAALSRREVAERMGYQNLQKGMANLAIWERGDDRPRGDRVVVLAWALRIDPERLEEHAESERQAYRRAAAEVERRHALDTAARRAERHLLAEHFPELLARADTVDRIPSIARVRLHSASWSIAFRGSGRLCLGALLHAWTSGLLVETCPCCGGSLYITTVGGSPFSNHSSLWGFCAATRELHNVKPTRGLSLSERSRALFALQRSITAELPPPDATLLEALAILGLPTPSVQLCDARGEPLALWRPDAGTLVPLGAAIGIMPAQTLQVSHRTIWAPARQGGRILLDSIAPLRFGSREAEFVELTDSDGRSWRHHPGYLEGPERQVVAQFDAPVPVTTAAVVHSLAM